jgi:predicted permease
MVRLRPDAVGAFVQGAFRGNLAYVGLPIVVYSLRKTGNSSPEKFEAVAVLVLAMIVPVYNIAAVIILLAARHKLDIKVVPKISKQVLTNPLFVSSVAGIIYSLAFDSLPLAAERTLDSIGRMALPLALLTIGARIAQEKITGHVKIAFAASVIKVAVGTIAGFFLANAVALGTVETRIALIFLACPTAVSTYILTVQIGGDDKLAADIVVVSSIFSLLSVSLVLAFF